MKKLSRLCKRAHIKPALLFPILAIMCLGILAIIWHFGPETKAHVLDQQSPSNELQMRSKLFGHIDIGDLTASPQETEELRQILLLADDAARQTLARGQDGVEALHEIIQSAEDELEAYIARYPTSGWSLSLRKELALRYQDAGRISRALRYWGETWDIASRVPAGYSKVLADYSLAHGTRLMASLGRLDELETTIAAHRARIMSEPHLAQIWVRTMEAVYHMRRKPGIAYMCGPYAINNVSKRLYGHRFGGVLSVPSSTNGFSLAELSALCSANNIDLVASVREPGADFILPAVVHWKQNHYAAITDESNGRFLVEDPTFPGQRKWISSEVIEEESSGFFLVPRANALPAGWRAATDLETLRVYGKGYFEFLDDLYGPECTEGGCCPPETGPDGTGNGDDPCGMPFWTVLEPNINLQVSDIPMKYDAAMGPDFVLRLNWRQRNQLAPVNNFGPSWESGILSYVFDPWGPDYGLLYASDITLYPGDGFSYTMSFAANATVSDQNPVSGTWAVRSLTNGKVNKIEVYYRNGAKDTYETTGSYRFRLASRADATGQKMTLTHDQPDGSNYRLQKVTMADGAEFTFGYQPWPATGYSVTSVTGVGRTVSFDYDGYNRLETVTDAAGIASSFTYQSTTHWIDSIITPYGTNSFAHFIPVYCEYVAEGGALGCSGIDRSIVITEPEGTHQVYAFYDNAYRNTRYTVTNAMAGKVPTAFASSQIPTYVLNDPPIQTLDTIRDERNSHYWNRQQAALIAPSILADLSGLTNSHFLVSRTRHWLRELNGGSLVKTLSWELPPSPDGVNEAQPVFFDYVGKDPANQGVYGYSYETYVGSENAPAVISQRMPDGSTKYDYFERNSLGMKTRHIERWVENGSVTKRTNDFLYATGTGMPHVDNLLKVEHKGPDGKLVFGRALHSTYNDQIGRETNAVGEVTIFDYNSLRQLTTKETAAGLLSTYSYNSTNRLAKVVDSASGTPIRTNSYTWLNGYQRTHTDPRNFTRTFDYDFLGRITQIAYSDSGSTTETFDYSLPAGVGFNSSGSSLAILDLVTHTDRMGNKSRTLPNRNRQIEKIIEPSRTTTGSFGTEHTIDYCGCGAPTSITRGSNTGSSETTEYFYDYQGKVTGVKLPNSTWVTNYYDVLGRLEFHDDALSSTEFVYDNLNRLLERRNAVGLIEGFGYDSDNHIIAATNSSGVLITNLYDNLGRISSEGIRMAASKSGAIPQVLSSPRYIPARYRTSPPGRTIPPSGARMRLALAFTPIVSPIPLRTTFSSYWMGEQIAQRGITIQRGRYRPKETSPMCSFRPTATTQMANLQRSGRQLNS